ncbi:pyridoxamine 5'-phosphate oxidase [Aureisphaera galaxeae]|uniref:pyridoxamine 5'-phosphate oxidase n=1 Tax=Aureisphaera galaxeae TaxID=1538023 RepID=UPI002350302A|nr:pyridoxamine 5'-phosphate oxidase [Aureisphaera galaxeae]MDC8004101.1 pyridoxamine 5'-phosphate oxidase [Aureisphaera galaxeae]
MRDNLHDYRKSYEKGVLDTSTVDSNPLQQFRTWFYQVQDAGGVDEANAMTLTTIGLDGFPKGRVVLLKKYDENGFYFYTNYTSEKGEAILANPNVSLSFFWPNLERQVLIKGIAQKTSEVDSSNYFASRPKGSQLGAMVSNQSSVVESREALEEELKALEETYDGKEVPKPDDWGGFVVQPVEFEFWQGRPNRLHDRIRYRLDQLDWVIERLAP